ncbi:CRISPR-associated endonuclease Cas2 [Psychrobacter arenosus]|uniref:CRISPR-associated endonuclease Cas2 n=1 Tax=Psychrobacter arenosus TaxID=256326 RepID=UPI0019195077|nr:CRISPR-associated endonuclease Cas2 [Psychrobacter arenosus]
MTVSHFVLCYDIADKKRLQRLQRLVSNHLIQLQYSVYYGSLSKTDIDKLISQIQDITHKSQDDIRVYETEPITDAFVITKHSSDIMLFENSY